MEIRLHANATTTPKQRAYIQRSTRPVAELAVELGVSETTIRRWRGRDTVQDHPHTPRRLATILNPPQEFVVVELRKLLLLPLDDLLVVAREFVCPELSRSALDRCLRRHGVARLADLLPEAEGQPPLPKPFKAYEPGFVHVDIKYLPRMPDEAEHRYLIAAIDRASRWVYFEIQPDKSADTAAGFLERLRAKAPFVPYPHRADRQRERVHRPLLRHRRARTDGPASLRSRLCPTRHRASLDQTQASPDQRHDRTLQWSCRRGVEKHHVHLRSPLGNDLATVSASL